MPERGSLNGREGINFAGLEAAAPDAPGQSRRYIVDDMSTIIEAVRLGGVSEVAAELRVTRQQVAKLRQRDEFPSPAATLSIGEVWDLDVIRRWAGSGLRRAAGRPSSRPQPLAVGRRFELGTQIGDGGFAAVFSARDLAAADGARVAVKVLQEARALDPDVVARFKRELQLMSQLSDPHVMPVLASGTDEQLGLWYAMPLALGSLADHVGTAMDQDAVVAVMREICAGLAYIHDNQILHRDLKPSNVLRTPAGAWAIADFGLARSVAETSARITATADTMGTPFYTAPEQWKDAKHVDETADVYSAGKILQALVTGGTPVDDDVPPGNLRDAIMGAIVPDPRYRYESAARLLTAIEAATSRAGRRETPRTRARRLRPRLAIANFVDWNAVSEVISWTREARTADYKGMSELAETLTALPAGAIEGWWRDDPAGLTRAFQTFAGHLRGRFDSDKCEPFADFAQQVVSLTGDQVILREAVRGLAELGHNHNRWHVRDVTVTILQNIRDDQDAAAALEGLRMAGRPAAKWTVGKTIIRTLHPILKAGLDQFLDDSED
jgi:hypothetical protein